MRVTGGRSLQELEFNFRTAGSRADAEVAENLEKLRPKIPPVFREQAITHLPKREGYAATFAEAMEVRSHVRASYGMTLTVYSRGKRERRDIVRLNRYGILRHPVFGRIRQTKKGPIPNPWVAQTRGVRKGFVDEAADKTFDMVGDAVKE